MRLTLATPKPVDTTAVVEPVTPVVEPIVLPDTCSLILDLVSFQQLAAEGLNLDVQLDQLMTATETMDTVQDIIANGKFTMGTVAVLQKNTDLAKIFRIDGISLEGVDMNAPVNVATESVANTIATIWQHILAWLKRIIAFIKNSWGRFVNEMNDRKKFLQTAKATIAQKGIADDSTGMSSKNMNICPVAALNEFKDAALKISRVLEGFTSIDKMAGANHVTELGPEFAKIGFSMTNGPTDEKRYVITRASEMPVLENATLASKGWKISNVNQCIDDAIVVCENAKSLERTIEVFSAYEGLVEKNISNSKQNMENVDAGTKEGVKEAAIQADNIRKMYMATLDAIKMYVHIVANAAATATHSDAPATTTPPPAKP